ncbi:prolyl 4-hydroxylase subunit alpha-1-like [Daphnia pulicaria]|uniref:prolyl 4-hydroxylase subunit alpha-1-like n=1 Tax=Daphnia pulicaria TaxID=35523 RepID=UPI001EEAF98B|nr:prolyl 4-hydroxylase subunit alpha-1-like [Daphnia pulicaria]
MALASDMYSSVAELERLYLKEQQAGLKLESLLDLIKKQTTAIDQYLSELREIRSANLDSRGVISNPINAFHMMRRLTIGWREVKTTLEFHGNVTDIVQDVFKISKSFPNDEDLSGAAFSLAQLQGAYRLNVSQLASGNVQLSDRISFPSVRGLNARDCLFIGKHAFNKGLYGQAVDWISTAVEVARSENNRSASVSEIKPFLSTAIRVHDDVLEKKGPIGADWRTNPEPFERRAKSLSRARRSQEQQQQQTQRMRDITYTPLGAGHGLATNKSPEWSEWEEMEVFFRLCREGEEESRPTGLKGRLKCRQISHTHPYFILRPLKLEEHSLVPYIAVFHDFMSDAETEIFKSLAMAERLERSAHGSKRPGQGGVTSDKRTSKQSWVEDGSHHVVDQISKRISDSVGLNSQPSNVGSEHYQVANYGIGGRYTPHTDHGVLSKSMGGPSEFDLFRGDRILTFMTYLDDVEAGGATVFTHAGVVVRPKKGMAVFWWNLKSDSSGDTLTRHGGCPVLHGSKWIANKWFHSGEQFLKRPCAKKPRSRISYPGTTSSWLLNN